MKLKILAALSVAIPFLLLWIACWFFKDLKVDDWKWFPGQITAIFAIMGSAFLAFALNFYAWESN